MPPDTQGLPWPEGEPEAVRAAARRANALAAALDGMHGTVAATDAPGWTGTAATAFDGAVERDAAVLSTAAAAFTEAAGALQELGIKLESARERVLEAAQRLREEREAAAAAAARAQEAREIATSAHAAAALDMSSPFGGVLASEASAAEESALRAEAAAANAQMELERVEAWARRQAQDAVQDARAADQRAAGVLQGSAAGPLGATTGTPSAALAGGPALGPLGGFINGSLFNYWGGGPDRAYMPIGKMVAGGAFMAGTARWMRAASVASSWARVAPGGPGTLTAYAAQLAHSRLPTFNNGLLGRGLASGLSSVPATRGAGSWLANTSRATPVFRGLGIAGGGVSTVLDTAHLIRQGNPVEAFQRDGAGYVADVGRTAFSASTTAFLIAPNPVTGGAVLVSGTVWLGAEAWDHREEIADAVSTGAEWAWDHSLVGAAWNHREEIGAAIDSGVDTARNFAEDVGERWDQGVDMVQDGLSTATEGAGDFVDDITPDDWTPW